VKNRIVAACVLAMAAPAAADVIEPAAVVYGDYGEVEQSLTGESGDIENGRAVFINRRLGNCLACHENSDMADQPFHGEVGPNLDGVGDRWAEADLRGILVNSKNVFPGTIMPAFYRNEGFIRVRDDHAGNTIMSAQEVEDVLAYLMTLQE